MKFIAFDATHAAGSNMLPKSLAPHLFIIGFQLSYGIELEPNSIEMIKSSVGIITGNRCQLSTGHDFGTSQNTSVLILDITTTLMSHLIVYFLTEFIQQLKLPKNVQVNILNSITSG